MAAKKWIHQIKEALMFVLFMLALLICGLVAIVTFVLFVQARGRGDEKRELFYKSVHYTSLALFTLLGVLTLILVSQTSNFG